MAKFDLRALARRGAEAKIAELHEELEQIYAAFPELRRAGAAGLGSRAPAGRRRQRPPMSSGQRKAVSERMKKYWAERRKAKS